MTIYDNMARYDAIRVVHNPPPVCPSCGSHRTEIVGKTDAPPTLIVRCIACGARSSVPLEEAKSDGHRMDDVNVELEVIEAVGRALARLSQPDAQGRVIRWINDRFQPRTAGAAATVTTNSTPETQPRTESRMGEFVTDFQRIALEWQGA